MKTFSLYQLFVSTLFCVIFFWSNQTLGENVNALPKWNLVNQTFINAVSQQDRFNISNPLDRGTTSISKVAPIRSPLSPLDAQKRLKTPVLLPRLRPTVTKFSSDVVNPIIPETTNEKAKNAKKESLGIWRLEIGNEDRGVFVDVWEPIFDPIFGGSPTDGGMSWGFHLSYTPQGDNPAWVNQLRPYIPWVEKKSPRKNKF